ncbi:MAG: hypothetical protein HYT37_01910 [Candidatus Sungbacteria bacterium]|nr:hypothetical protein [Candidatus Sungbacteria bacterium]
MIVSILLIILYLYLSIGVLIGMWILWGGRHEAFNVKKYSVWTIIVCSFIFIIGSMVIWIFLVDWKILKNIKKYKTSDNP